MSRHRTGPIFTQEILNNLIRTMEGEIPTDQSDEAVFQEKVHALQRFLHHGMSRFSTESLQQVLDSILPPKTPGTPVGSASGRPSRKMEVRSIKELRDVVKMIMTKRESGSIRACDADALKYMEHFFFAVYCMSEAKRLIDDVFADLYYSYYKPETESRQPTRVGSGIKTQGDHGVGPHTEDYSQFGISTLEQLTGSTGHKLRLTVKDMQDVLTRWAELLIQGEPDLASFEPESEQDLLLVRAAFHTQPILRLLPDTFAKFYKCLELSKQWWVLAHDVYPDLPFQRHPPEESGDLLDQVESPSGDSHNQDRDKSDRTSQVLLETKEAMREINNEIEAVQEELEALSKREEKFTILVETYDKVGQDIEIRNRERQQLYTLRDKLAQSGQQDASNREELQRAEFQIRQLDGMIKLLEFQHSLLLQDYLIHMEIRPSIIRFQGEAALKLRDAQLQLEQQALNLEKLEHEVSSTTIPNDSVSQSDDEDRRDSRISTDSPSTTPPSRNAKDNKDEKNVSSEEKIPPAALKRVRKISEDVNKNIALQTSNNKRQVAFAHNEVIKNNSNQVQNKSSLSSVKSYEKSKTASEDTGQPPAKLADKRKIDHFAQTRTKRNSLPGTIDPQKTNQRADRRRSHDVTNNLADKTNTKELQQMKKNLTSKNPQNKKEQLPEGQKDPKDLQQIRKNPTSINAENKKEQLSEGQKDVPTSNKRLNPLVKSKSSKDVISNPKNETSDGKSHALRSRRSSDPPAPSNETVSKTNKKPTPPKAWEKTLNSTDVPHVQRIRAPRPRPSPAIQNSNTYVK